MSDLARMTTQEAVTRNLADLPTQIRLSWPPSLNNMFINVRGRGRVKADAYTQWRNAAGWELLSQKAPRFTGPVKVLIELCTPHKRRYDPDNRVKPVMDLLVEHRVIAGDTDKHIREITVRPVDSGPACTVTVFPA